MAGLGTKLILKVGDESTWGTAVTRTKAININRESIVYNRAPLKAPILFRAGNDVNEEAQGGIRVGGDLVWNPHYGGGWLKFLKAALGTVATTQPDPTNAATVYRHTFTWAESLLDGIGLTVEMDKDRTDSKAYIYSGGKVSRLRMSFGSQSSLLEFVPTMIFKDEVADTATGSLSPSTTPLIRGVDMALTWGGSSKNMYALSLDINNALLDDEGILGTTYIDEPIRGAKNDITGSFTCRFTSTSEYEDFVAATSRQLVLTATGATITGAFAYKMTVTMPYVRLRGSTPNVSSPGRIPIEHPFEALTSGSNSAITVVVDNTDTSV